MNNITAKLLHINVILIIQQTSKACQGKIDNKILLSRGFTKSKASFV